MSAAKDGDKGWDQQGARDQGVEQEADAEGEGDLTESLDRDQGHGGEGEGEDEAGHGDRAAGADAGGPDRRAQLLVLRLLPDAADQEDVVVGAQGQEEDRTGDRHEEGQLAVAEQVLEDVDRDAERRGHDQQAAANQIQRRRPASQQEPEQQQQDHQGGGRDPLEGGGRVFAQFGGDRRVAGDSRSDALQAAAFEQGRQFG